MELKLFLQILGVALGLCYLYLEYKANIWLWVVGLIMPIVHGTLYFKSGLYADFSMQLYYILAGIYGLWVWSRGRSSISTAKPLKISHTPLDVWLKLVVFYVAIHSTLYVLLTTFTDSTVPGLDSFTTALCIIAYWMLSRKFVEQWLVWLVIDAVTVGLYIYKGIPLTAGLYALYTLLAVVGYMRWRKMMLNEA